MAEGAQAGQVDLRMPQTMLLRETDVVERVGGGALTADGFPRPMVTGPGGRMWLSTDVERWREAHQPAADEHPKQTRPQHDRGAQTRPAE